MRALLPVLALLTRPALAEPPRCVTDWYGLDHVGTMFTGYLEVPRDRPRFVPQYTAFGLPRTAAAWTAQARIDGGKLAAIKGSTVASEAAAGRAPATWGEDGWPADKAAARTLEVAVVRAYLDNASAHPGAAVILELMPTETDPSALRDIGGAVVDKVVRGEMPNDFVVGPTTALIRSYATDLAGVLGGRVYALPVPYANTRANILFRDGKPTDGAQDLLHTLTYVDERVRTVAIGYSQGSAALLAYLKEYGELPYLDAAVVLAPMGGADRMGATGVWAGDIGVVPTLTVANANDPAPLIHGDSLWALLGPLTNFTKAPEHQRGDLRLHASFYGTDEYPVAEGVDPILGSRAGTMGYPAAYLTGLYGALLDGAWAGKPYARRGEWREDLRKDLVHLDPEGRPLDFGLGEAVSEVVGRYR